MKRFVIRTTALLSALVAGIVGSTARAQGDADEVDWLSARADGTVDAFERYLARHPFGKHADQAFYFVTVLSLDRERNFERIEPGAGPQTLSESGALSAAMDVY